MKIHIPFLRIGLCHRAGDSRKQMRMIQLTRFFTAVFVLAAILYIQPMFVFHAMVTFFLCFILIYSLGVLYKIYEITEDTNTGRIGFMILYFGCIIAFATPFCYMVDDSIAFWYSNFVYTPLLCLIILRFFISLCRKFINS